MLSSRLSSLIGLRKYERNVAQLSSTLGFRKVVWQQISRGDTFANDHDDGDNVLPYSIPYQRRVPGSRADLQVPGSETI